MNSIRQRLSPKSNPDLVFWLCLLTLNFLLFLPLYLLSADDAAFLPLAVLKASGSLRAAFTELTVWRNNLDPFRLNVELLVLTAIWVHVRWVRWRAYRYLFTVFYLVAFSYYVYEGIVVSIFQVDPVFYVEYYMAQDGIPVLLGGMQLPFMVYLAGFAGLAAMVYLMVRMIATMMDGVPVDRLSRWSRWGLAVVTVVILGVVLEYRVALANPRMVVSSVLYKVEKNVGDSLRIFETVSSFDDSAAYAAYNYGRYPLVETPDIYLIFVESYGSVLYKRPDFKESYLALLDELEPVFADNGWHTTSALSEAPTWGGGSWMSYSSALYGLRIDSHPQYLALLDRYQSERYPHLANYLRGQGYTHYRISSMPAEIKEHEWLKYRNFYGVDTWLRYRDLGYVGPRYGWGPTPPDQYVVNFAQAHMDADTDGPHLFFHITQNSHYPWMPLPELVDDWRDLNVAAPDDETPDPEAIEHSTRRQNYMNAVGYQLRFLQDFILRHADENSVFVLVGDHQPPRVSRHSDGWDTPIHIISKNPTFVDHFAQYGFEPGLAVSAAEPAMHHEAFYSMFARGLIEAYGRPGTVLPPYLPNGIAIEQEEFPE